MGDVSVFSTQSFHTMLKVYGVIIDVFDILKLFEAWDQSELIVVSVFYDHPLGFLSDEAIGGVALISSHMRFF